MALPKRPDRFRYDAIVLFNQLRVIPGMTFGFSATTNSIGVEREREITNPGNARLLGYLGPEIAFSTLNMSELELVISVHHRSGADHTFGNFGEGYNANIRILFQALGTPEGDRTNSFIGLSQAIGETPNKRSIFG